LRRLQQYDIYKFSSARLKKSNYKINITIQEGRKNGEVISLGDSQMLRSLRQLKNQENNEAKIHELIIERKQLKSKSYSEENVNRLLEIEKELDNLIFVGEIISIFFDKSNHYKDIIKNGLYINGKNFVRLLCSAGNARRNIAMFIDKEYEKPLKKILNNDRKDIEIIPAKFNAYFSLAASSSIPVSTPYFMVAKDCEVNRLEKVDFVSENKASDDSVEETEKLVTQNLWDGQGLISPKFAAQWASELNLDYVPSMFVVRTSFVKGIVIVFDFHRFSDETGIHILKDAWDRDYNIRDADVIITQSQFKLWNAWDSLEDYTKACTKNNITWNVTKWSPEQEKTHVLLNYQFLQPLNLNTDQIKSLCKKTVDFFQCVAKNENYFTMLYLLGDLANREYDERVLEKIGDPVTKAILLNNNLINDSYIQNHIIHSLNKKIKESFIGSVVVNGFYTTSFSDPYAFCEFIFGLPIKGLLNRNEHYNRTWLDRGKNILASMRAPLTAPSEINILHLKDNDDVRDWYRYLNTGCVFNVFGVDAMLEGGADYDADTSCLTDAQEIIDGAQGGNPIHYETVKAQKSKVDESELYKFDLKGFNSPVGFLTNLSTTMYAMMPIFDMQSIEYQTIVNRLKICRKQQGAIIDSAKGLEIKPIPIWWSSWTKINDGFLEEEKTRAEFNNSIMVDKRPYFFRYLYSKYNKKYNQYTYAYEEYCKVNLGRKLKDILEDPQNDKELEVKRKYYKYNVLLDTPCLMNNLCHYLEGEIKLIKENINNKPNEYLTKLLKDSDIPIDKEKLKKLYDLYKIYKSERRDFNNIKNANGEGIYKTLEQYYKHIRQEAFKISNNVCELASLSVIICYEAHPFDSKTFAWGCFPEGILKNIEKNRQDNLYMPFLDEEKGDIEFLGKKYSMKEIVLPEKQEPDEYYF
jgi:hypothetical protein